MGFVGFIRFSFLFLDFFAWPAFALAYPLWASIRAIETSSKYNMRKLVTYWTIFSLISLFEIFFAKFIEWVPFWPYIKLVAICLLAIPRFDGACHVYQCLVHPCLSVNLQDVINWFWIPKEKSPSEERFLASVETYIKENGPEALEKLIANKANCKEHILADADALEVVKRVEPTDNVTAEEQLIEHSKPHLAQSEKKEIATVEAQKVAIPEESKEIAAAEAQKVVIPAESKEIATAEAQKVAIPAESKEIAAAEAQKVVIPAESDERESLEIPALKKVQREWTCAMCQVTTTSEALLNSHLFGKKHMSNCEKLKTCTLTAKNMQSPAVKQKSRPEELKTPTMTKQRLFSSAVKTNDSNQVKENLKNCSPGEGSRQNTTEKLKSNHINVASWQQMQEKAMNNIAGVVNWQSKFRCGICNVRCTSEINLVAHLNGRKHVFEIQSKPMNNNAGAVNQQSKFWCEICNIGCTSEVDVAAHLRGRKHVLQIQSMITPAGIAQA